MVVAAVDRILTDVVQGVVHPAHVPLQPKAKSAGRGWGGDAGEGGGLLRDHHGARGNPVGNGVGFLEQRDGLEVLASAVDVGLPGAGLTRVVQVEHGGNGVNAQTVDVELLQPVGGVRHQEVAHLGPAEVEHQRAPVLLLAAARVGVLVQGGAVEVRQSPGVLGEVRRDPVQDDAYANAVKLVHQVAQVIRNAEPRRRGVVGGDLVAPRATERVLGHRHQFNVREPEPGHVVGQLIGGLPIAQALLPRSEVNLVDRHGAGVRVAACALLHPVAVIPDVVRDRDHGGR